MLRIESIPLHKGCAGHAEYLIWRGDISFFAFLSVSDMCYFYLLYSLTLNDIFKFTC